jgi:DNA-binding beta-propeller fold protein YncE
MRSISRNVVVLGAALISAFTSHEIRTYGQASHDFPNPYKIEDFGQLPRAARSVQIYGIDIDRDGKSVWVFERCGAAHVRRLEPPPLLKFDSSGRLVASFGAGMFVYPHGLFVDVDDNIWVTDGQAKTARAAGLQNQSDGTCADDARAGGVAATARCVQQPSDVLVAPNGSIFVADGHGGDSNARIVKFDKDGSSSRRGAGRDRDRRVRHAARPRPRSAGADCSLPIAATAASRCSTRTASSLPSGNSGGVRAASHSIAPDLLYAADSGIRHRKREPHRQARRAYRRISVTGSSVLRSGSGGTDLPGGGGREGIAVDRDGVVYLAKTGAGGLYRYTKTKRHGGDPLAFPAYPALKFSAKTESPLVVGPLAFQLEERVDSSQRRNGFVAFSSAIVELGLDP